MLSLDGSILPAHLSTDHHEHHRSTITMFSSRVPSKETTRNVGSKTSYQGSKLKRRRLKQARESKKNGVSAARYDGGRFGGDDRS